MIKSCFALELQHLSDNILYDTVYTYNQIHLGPQKWVPKWVPETLGPEGTPIAKTLEFVMREQKKTPGPAPLLEKFRRVGFGSCFGGIWVHSEGASGSLACCLGPLSDLFGVLWELLGFSSRSRERSWVFPGRKLWIISARTIFG